VKRGTAPFLPHFCTPKYATVRVRAIICLYYLDGVTLINTSSSMAHNANQYQRPRDWTDNGSRRLQYRPAKGRPRNANKTFRRRPHLDERREIRTTPTAQTITAFTPTVSCCFHQSINQSIDRTDQSEVLIFHF